MQCALVDPTLAEIGRRSVELTPYAWVFRYPGDPEPPTVEDAVESLGLAREIHAALLSRLPASARP